MLTLLAEKVMPEAIKPGLVAYCPTMDLLAVATVNEQVHVFRLNGQRVFGYHDRKNGGQVLQLQWKPNGQLLAIVQDNLRVLLISAQTGKCVHQIQYKNQAKAQICKLSWSVNLTDTTALRSASEATISSFDIEEALAKGFEGLNSSSGPNLPKELAFLDNEAVLPKLSTLPAGGKDDEVFSTRASLDALFQSSRKNWNSSADVLLVMFDDGSMNLTIYDFFEIGSFSPAQVGSVEGKIIDHCSHPLSSMHGLLLASKDRGGLYFLPLDLRLIPATQRYLPLLASKSTQLLNLLRYMSDVQILLYNEFKTAHDLPSRFMQNVEESLQEKEQNSFIIAAYQLAATGICTPVLKEWLVEELGERGYKRWDKAMVSGYETIRRLTYENLLPSLDRFSLLISRLRGLAKAQESSISIGLVTAELDRVLDTMNCLRLLAHTILIDLSEELRQFQAFSLWMRYEIDRQASEPSSRRADEANEKDPPVNIGLVLRYIRGALSHSRLAESLAKESLAEQGQNWNELNQLNHIYDAYKALRKGSATKTSPDERLPHLEQLIGRISTQCHVVFDHISETERRKVHFGTESLISRKCDGIVDMRMQIEANVENLNVVYIAFAENSSPSDVRLKRITYRTQSGLSSVVGSEFASISLPRTRQISKLKYIDDDQLLVIVRSSVESSPESRYQMLYFPYCKASDVQFFASEQKASPEISEEELMQTYVRHEFGDELWSAPAGIEINGRKGKRALCVVAQDNVHYRIFDIDSRQEDGQDEAFPDEIHEVEMSI